MAFIRFTDLAAARNLAGITSYILDGARGDPARLAHRIAAATGLSALTRAQSSAQERALVQDIGGMGR